MLCSLTGQVGAGDRTWRGRAGTKVLKSRRALCVLGTEWCGVHSGGRERREREKSYQK